MRHLLLVAVILVAVNLSAAQGSGPGTFDIVIAPSQFPGGYGAIRASGSKLYMEGEGPFAGVGAQAATTGAYIKGLNFGIRAWKENDTTRVVVYALLDDPRAPTGRTETPIRTFTISPGQTVEIPETEKWGAARVKVTATVRER